LPDDITLDEFEHVYISGRTVSQTLYFHSLPTASISQDQENDAFLAKFDANGNLLWCTYYGGLGDEKPFSIAIDPKTQEVVMGGKTSSVEGIAFNCSDPNPTDDDYTMDCTYSDNFDGFLAKFTVNGQVIRSTYIGGKAQDYLLGVTCYEDANGNVSIYATGTGEGDKGIVMPSHTDVEQYLYSGGDKDHGDVIVLKFNGDLSQRIWGSYYGNATGQERGHEIMADKSGNIYVVGTMSGGFNGLAKGTQIHQSVPGGSGDAHLSRWTSEGKMSWLTFLGGPEYERGRDVKTDLMGNIYIVGKTSAALSYPNAMVSSSDMVKTSSPIVSDQDGYVANSIPMVVASGAPSSGEPITMTYGAFALVNLAHPFIFQVIQPVLIFRLLQMLTIRKKSGGDYYFAKLNYNGTHIDYCTYYGGPGTEGGLATEFPDWYNGILMSHSRKAISISPRGQQVIVILIQHVSARADVHQVAMVTMIYSLPNSAIHVASIMMHLSPTIH
jgi:hypothetical protein